MSVSRQTGSLSANGRNRGNCPSTQNGSLRNLRVMGGNFVPAAPVSDPASFLGHTPGRTPALHYAKANSPQSSLPVIPLAPPGSKLPQAHIQQGSPSAGNKPRNRS